MATTKTIQPTGTTITIPAMTDRPDASVYSTDIERITDAVNAGNSNIANRLSTAKIYIERGNYSSFTISGLSNITNTSIFKHALLVWGVSSPASDVGLSLVFINTNGNVTINNFFGTARTFTGQVTNGNLVITANQTVYGGIKLIWLT